MEEAEIDPFWKGESFFKLKSDPNVTGRISHQQTFRNVFSAPGNEGQENNDSFNQVKYTDFSDDFLESSVNQLK